MTRGRDIKSRGREIPQAIHTQAIAIVNKKKKKKKCTGKHSAATFIQNPWKEVPILTDLLTIMVSFRKLWKCNLAKIR